MTDVTRERIVRYGLERGLMMPKEALDFLEKQPDWKERLDGLVARNEFVITQKNAENVIPLPKSFSISEADEKSKTFSKTEKNELMAERELSKLDVGLQEHPTDVEIVHTHFKPEAKDYTGNFRVMDEYDVTQQCRSQGKVKDFLEYFQQKFLESEQLLKKRQNFKPKNIKHLRTVSKNNEIELVGMISEKWKTKNGNLALRLEDLEESCIALIMKDDMKLRREKEFLMLDEVIGVKAVKLSEELVIIKELYWPDLPMRKEKTAHVDLRLAGLSDVHVGSRLFLDQAFEKFIEWINGKTAQTEKELEEVGKIKYLAVTGDSVDGIGVYPSQYDELAIKDIFKQYEKFEEYMLQIPEYIEVFLIPGNHDAVRNADPQPALPKKLIPELSACKNVHLMSSPSWVEIEGLKTLLYHGGSLHDLFAKVSSLSSAEPAKGMVELLKKRSLMAIYGEHRPYVPEQKDFMAIHEEPDLVFLGDHHRRSYAFYRGTTVINNSTFQARTSYQVKLGHIPTPGIIPVVNLQTRKIREYNFYEESGGN